jgi:hypothetical protein
MDDSRVFRQYRLIKLALPGLSWLVAIVLLSPAVLYLLSKSFSPARAIAM